MIGDTLPFAYCIAYRGKAKESLINAISTCVKGGEIINPVLERSEKHDGRWITKTISLTPGYLFLYTYKALSVESITQIEKVSRILNYIEPIKNTDTIVSSRSYELAGEDKEFALWIYRNKGIISVSKAFINDNKDFCIAEGPICDCSLYIKRIDKHNRKVLVSRTLNHKSITMWLSFEWVNP